MLTYDSRNEIIWINKGVDSAAHFVDEKFGPLFAAAPDLLEALDVCLQSMIFVGLDLTVMDEARAAIAKAKGEKL